MEEDAWRRSTQEASRRHPGGIQEAPRRHPGGTQEAPRVPRRHQSSFEAKCAKNIVFFCKSLRDRAFRLDETRASVTKYQYLHGLELRARSSGTHKPTHGVTREAARNPQRQALFG